MANSQQGRSFLCFLMFELLLVSEGKNVWAFVCQLIEGLRMLLSLAGWWFLMADAHF